MIGAIPVALPFGVVIGGLYTGFFTATESAAVGAFGAFLLALLRGKLNRGRLLEVLSETTATTALIYGLIFGALIFAFFVNLGQAPELAARAIGSIDATPIVILAVLLIFYLLLGAVMDSFAVMVITVPIVTPIVVGLGFDQDRSVGRLPCNRSLAAVDHELGRLSGRNIVCKRLSPRQR